MKAVAWLALILGLAGVCHARPDLNAFLNRRADTIWQLIDQVKNDRQVLDRYTRHYSLTRYQTLRFLATLRPAVLQKSGMYAIYSVPEGGALKRHMAMLKAGTRVYVRQNGQPELIAKCGNPLSEGPNDALLKNEVVSETVERQVEDLRSIEPEPLLADASEPDLIPGEPMTMALPPDIPDTVTTGGESPIPLVTQASPAFLFPFSLFAVGTQGGGHHEPTEAVPSPAAVLPFALGLLAAHRRRRVKRRG